MFESFIACGGGQESTDQRCRSAPAAAAARPAVAAASSDGWMTGSLSARAIPGSSKKRLTQTGSQSIQNYGSAVGPAPQTDHCYKNLIGIGGGGTEKMSPLERQLPSVRKETPARIRGSASSLTRGRSPIIPSRRASAGFDRSEASLLLMFLGMVADVSLCAIEDVGAAPPTRARPEILPPDYRLARMTEAAFHTNAVNT